MTFPPLVPLGVTYTEYLASVIDDIEKHTDIINKERIKDSYTTLMRIIGYPTHHRWFSYKTGPEKYIELVVYVLQHAKPTDISEDLIRRITQSIRIVFAKE